MPPLRVWRVWGLVALSAAVGGAIVVAFFALLAVSAVVTALKGQWPLFGRLSGGGIVWFIAASRLARPDAYWAHRFYGPQKMERSRARYGGQEG